MPEKKELNAQDLEQVTGGRGDRIWYSEIESVPLGSEIVFWCTGDGGNDHKVFLKRVDLANDCVYIMPSGRESSSWFSYHHKDSKTILKGSERNQYIEYVGNEIYKIEYTRGSPTYFNWL